MFWILLAILVVLCVVAYVVIDRSARVIRILQYQSRMQSKEGVWRDEKLMETIDQAADLR